MYHASKILKQILVSLLCLALILGNTFALAEEPLSGVSDNAPPTFSSINIAEKGQVLHPGDMIHFSVKIDDRSKISYANVYFWADVSGDFSFDLEYNPKTDRYEGEYELPASLNNDRYVLGYITANDEFNNYRELGGEEYGAVTLEGFTGKQNAEISFRLAENGQTITAGSDVHVYATIEDANEVYCFFERVKEEGEDPNADTEWLYCNMSKNEDTGEFEGTYTFREEYANGKYRMVEVCYIIDGQYHDKYFGDDSYYVNVTGGSDDRTPPEIRSIIFAENGKTLGPGDVLHVTVEVDDASALAGVDISFTGPNSSSFDGKEWNYEEYKKYREYWGTWSPFWINIQPVSDKVWEGTATLGDNIANTKYYISNVQVRDTAGNSQYTSYDDDQYWFNFDGPDIISESIAGFVRRCYQTILGREPDAGGMNTWGIKLATGQATASEIIDSFVRSNEFKGKNYSNADAVEILYNTMLGRGSDPAGKASWVAKLDAGQPLAAVINGFCGSSEFKAICHSYGIRSGSVDIPEEEPKTPDDKIKAFVKRCYKIILGRGADETGLNNWFNALKSRQRAASEIIDGFVRSVEFVGKHYSSEESVEILYKAMLGRGSDPKGKANWVAKLNAGQPLAVVINGFCGSQEFTGLCASYGIEPGRVSVPEVVGQAEQELSYMALNAEEPITKRSEEKPNRVEIINPSDTVDLQIGTAVQAVYINEEKAKEFVSRCYQYILGRSASENELTGWVAQMTNGTKTADQIARGFLFSGEFKGKNVGNENLVKILYRVYLNRGADPAGLASWTAKLDSGMGLKDLLDSLVKTAEYKNVISEMGK